MRLQFDLSKEYGLVLEGGGAKGAYQIGAWKALREEGIKIKGLSGVSVGALNGALICMDDLDKANEIWENISYSQVLDVDDERMDSIIRGDLKNINLNEVIGEGLRVIRERGLDVTPLKNLIARVCDEDAIRRSPMDFYIVTYSLSDHQLIDVNAKDVPKGLIADMLLASAYLPAFKREPLHGKRYIDGGVQDRVPLDSLINRGYQNIIVLRIHGFGVEKRIRIPEEVRVTDIAPRQNLGGILEFDSARSRRNMKLGYYDAKRMLYGLTGDEFYLDMELTEEESCGRLQKMALRHVEAEAQREKAAERENGPGRVLGGRRLDRISRLRYINEELFPETGRRLLKGRSWSYRELYTAVVERTAIELRISRYAVYTEEEILTRIREKLRAYKESGKELPDYADFFE
ncbi:MAG: patatin-like phospholipase family protein [Lachnospiraceae bacterium]|jgi:NTE family protein|nr:patatin-like phospholipase family protein [Lachnospiraceae bacterium]